MPIALVTPYDPGDLDPGQSYTHVELRSFAGDFEANEISFEFKYGTLDQNSKFVWGKVDATRFIVKDRPRLGTTDYTNMMAELSLDDELTSAAVGRIIYTYALMNGLYVGTPLPPNP